MMQKFCKFPGCGFPVNKVISKIFCSRHLVPAIMLGLQKEYKPKRHYDKKYFRSYYLAHKEKIDGMYNYRYKKGYIEVYRGKHKKEIKKYIRNYMREYRKTCAAKGRQGRAARMVLQAQTGQRTGRAG